MSAMKRMFRALGGPPPLKASPDAIASVARAVQAAHKAEYRKGLKDGVAMTLDHVEGKAAGGVPYEGELPDELRIYLKRTRAALDEL